jgi:PAS domain S-box-containing protein
MGKRSDGTAASHGLSELHTDAISSGVIICDADGIIVDCNRTATEMLRLSRPEIVGRSLADHDWLPAAPFVEDGRPLGDTSARALADLRAGRNISPTVVGACAEGESEPSWILVGGHPLPPDEQGRATGAVLTVTDITAQKRAETLYAAVVDELHGVLHALPDLYFRLDADDLVVDFNIGSGFDAYVTSDDIVGRRPEEFLPPEVSRGMRKAIAAARLSREVQTFETTLDTLVAGRACFEGRQVALPDGGAVVIVRDMTERRQAEEELMRSEALYRSFFERASVGIFVFDPDLHVTACNDAFVTMTGRSHEECTGVDLRRFGDRRCGPALRAALAGQESSYDGPYLSVDGVSGIVSLRAQPVLDGDGAVVGGIGVITHLSQRLAVEQREAAGD